MKLEQCSFTFVFLVENKLTENVAENLRNTQLQKDAHPKESDQYLNTYGTKMTNTQNLKNASPLPLT